MRRILQAQAIALMAMALVSGGALAQDADDVTVQASRIEKADFGRTSSGMPVLSLSVSHEVSYSDLDLATTEGVAELQSRIREAARHGCREIDLSYRFTQPNDWLCTRLATKEAMDQVRELVAAN
jgi:UrcA family protein